MMKIDKDKSKLKKKKFNKNQNFYFLCFLYWVDFTHLYTEKF